MDVDTSLALSSSAGFTWPARLGLDWRGEEICWSVRLYLRACNATPRDGIASVSLGKWRRSRSDRVRRTKARWNGVDIDAALAEDTMVALRLRMHAVSKVMARAISKLVTCNALEKTS